jgi:signal transduction histidine kinase
VNATRERLQILVPAGAVLVLVLLLTVLLIGSRSTGSAVLDHLQASLQNYELHDAELTRDALLARSGLLPNYDPLVVDRLAVRDAFNELQSVAAGAGPATHRALQAPLDELGAAQQTKLVAVEHFKSNNALLRNSLLYFAYVGPSLRLPLQQQTLAAQLGRLSYAVLSFLQSPSPATEQEILDLLNHIERAAGSTPDLDSLVAHGRLLVRVLPWVDQQLRIIHETPVGPRVQALRTAAMARAESEERMAQRYRYAMYLASLSLLASLAWLLLRLRARALELRAAQDRLRQQRLALVESNKLANLGLHLEGVAHDMRGPLNVIKGGAAHIARIWPELQEAMDDVAVRNPALELCGQPWKRMRPVLEPLPADLLAQSAYLANFAQDLLNMGRPRGERGVASFDANQAIEQALRLVRHAVHERTDRFELLLTPGLPQVRGDPLALGQVLVNLLNNALEALPDRHRAVRIRTRLAGEGQLAILVEDEGHGIGAADLARLFEPFFTTKQGRGGTGLGLSTSRAMLETMGASLRIDSVPGEGTRATIVMPLVTPLAGNTGSNLHGQA